MASSDWQYTAHMPANFLRGREPDAGKLWGRNSLVLAITRKEELFMVIQAKWPKFICLVKASCLLQTIAPKYPLLHIKSG